MKDFLKAYSLLVVGSLKLMKKTFMSLVSIAFPVFSGCRCSWLHSGKAGNNTGNWRALQLHPAHAPLRSGPSSLQEGKAHCFQLGKYFRPQSSKHELCSLALGNTKPSFLPIPSPKWNIINTMQWSKPSGMLRLTVQMPVSLFSPGPSPVL